MTKVPHISVLLRWLAAGLAAWLSLFAAPLQAQEEGNAQALQATREWLDGRMREGAGTPSTPGLRMEVVVGQLDPRLRLAPCQRIEPYVPVNGRLWGRSQVGLRCVQGVTKWNVFLPVTVKAWGPAWVLKSNIAPGTPLRPSDAMQAEVDWAADNSPVLAQVEQWVGHTSAYPLVAGQPLRQAMVRASQVFAIGATVRIIAQGPGFQVSSQGLAQSPGIVGQPVRVRMDNGSVVNGKVLDGNTVVMQL